MTAQPLNWDEMISFFICIMTAYALAFPFGLIINLMFGEEWIYAYLAASFAWAVIASTLNQIISWEKRERVKRAS
jgi:hypothetical protein